MDNNSQLILNDYSKNMLYNIFDNIEKSIAYLNKDAKSSAISLYSAVELTFKLRLFIENWFLILQDIDQANFEAFKKGEFCSIYLDTAANRIKILFNDLDSKYNANNFNKLKFMRNSIIHFDKYKTNDPIIKEAIYSAWHPLFNLLSNKWKKSFEVILQSQEYNENLNKLEKRFIKLSSKYYKPVKETLLENSRIKNKQNKNYGKSQYELNPGYNNNEICINCHENKLGKINFLYKKETKYLTLYTCDVCEESFIGSFNYTNIEKEITQIIKNDINSSNISRRLPKLAYENFLGKLIRT